MHHHLGTMAVGLLFHIPSQLQCSVLYGDYTDLQRHSESSEVGGGGEGGRGFYLKFEC